MLRFLLGIAFGAAISFGYVKWGGSFFDMMGLPDRLRGNIFASASEGPLYELQQDADTRRRALEVFFDNQAEMAARIDAEAGHPFLTVLHVRRAAREAGHLHAQWQAFDVALDQPALRQALERRHATMDTVALKRKMLVEALAKQPFLQDWIARHHPGTAEEGLVELLAQITRRRVRS
ncbi:MAG: hypothetical protein SFW09_06370 [Hyphomicrobiaceae bacterium]|nr:hypothetical protein [Hyphomicrobiaceae bacterium]